ncbi:MAG: beta-propeller fold lactonase family protein [Phycisphaerae bacterium]|nr:beta-propeller fold lactonase family protein [Phycisphaerae bacterium]NIP53455.1 beta-propeller fold lactonase family protein [Phycisphaerae bacterium]NIS52416.1 beta-propeller fold lactonase family protein [Phycisphaerae bacterium]NIU09948.1 beta-propeller fold lactonase family protein [Phycisphaerae bacterium]NIU60200.1 beta-propeller fold lactonase family protein [Phycisphaerae bacterium]
MRRSLLFTLFIIVLVPVLWAAEDQQKHPVYVGAKVCASCHQGKNMGHQFSRWLHSKHATAYAVLAKPESKKIAVLSGIPQEPQESPMCLGCHATGAHVEAWEKDETFFTEDGVQCEKCHGPGSEYIDAAIMVDRQAATKAGLIMPTERDCMGCHQVKGSHVAIHKLPKLDISKALKEIAHPTPKNYKYGPMPQLPKLTNAMKGRPKNIGIRICASCHKGPAMGYQFSKWRMSAHAKAYAVLGTDKAYKIAKSEGLKEEPRTSKACLKCHTTAYHEISGGSMDIISVYEGVGCEACHGAGSNYYPEAIMRDGRAARAAGLKEVTRKTCLGCHENAHDKPFDFDEAVKKIAHPTEQPKISRTPRYKTPLNMAIGPNGKEIYVACEASHTVIVVDAKTLEKTAEIKTGHHPTDVTFSPDGTRAYVSNRLDDTVSVIDVSIREVTATIAVGDEPHGLLTDTSGKYLYVLNTSSNNISVVDTATLKEIKRLSASRNPWSLSLSPDGSLIYVTNNLSRFVKFRNPSISEITAIDTERGVVEDRLLVPAANLMQGIDWHPSGRFALVTLNRTKNLVPMTRLLQGWTITNGLAIVWKDGRVDQVLLDEPGMCFPDPADIAITPDGRLAVVTSSGSNRVAVVDVPRLISMLEDASLNERERVFPNHLGKPVEFVITHIPVSHSPRGVLITPDGKTAFVANALDDSLSIIDLDKLESTGKIDLGGPKVITKVRFGERVFHSADITFHRQFSCHSCHPDGHVDGITYDIEPDGIGVSPVDNRTLRGILDTAPFKWEGTNPSLQRQCGPRLAVFFTRIQPFTPEQLSALENYICTIPRPPNRYRPLGAELTDAQRRGKKMFERTVTNDGRIIPKGNRCVTCHFPPLYTDRRRHDIGTMQQYDRETEFDTPHINNIYDSAPYLHNGIAESLEEIWTRYNLEDKHGMTNDMTKDQLNDLIEYIKTL